MTPPKKEDKISVVAELSLTSPQGTEIVRSFDGAWQRAKALPLPVHIQFIRFVRKD